MKRFLLVFFVFAFVSIGVQAQTTFTINEVIRQRRVGDPQISPDGRTVAFTVGDVNIAENKTLTHIYTMRIGGENIRQITQRRTFEQQPALVARRQKNRLYDRRTNLDDGRRRRR